jgi:hypothetical protein
MFMFCSYGFPIGGLLSSEGKLSNYYNDIFVAGRQRRFRSATNRRRRDIHADLQVHAARAKASLAGSQQLLLLI